MYRTQVLQVVFFGENKDHGVMAIATAWMNLWCEGKMFDKRKERKQTMVITMIRRLTISVQGEMKGNVKKIQKRKSSMKK